MTFLSHISWLEARVIFTTSNITFSIPLFLLPWILKASQIFSRCKQNIKRRVLLLSQLSPKSQRSHVSPECMERMASSLSPNQVTTRKIHWYVVEVFMNSQPMFEKRVINNRSVISAELGPQEKVRDSVRTMHCCLRRCCNANCPPNRLCSYFLHLP